jgi:hypothetical protein
MLRTGGCTIPFDRIGEASAPETYAISMAYVVPGSLRIGADELFRIRQTAAERFAEVSAEGEFEFVIQ